jgi:hypothetical protein
MIFSAPQLERLVRDQLPADAIPGEKVVIGTVDRDGIQVLAAFKNQQQPDRFGHPAVGGLQWEFQGAARHDWDGSNSLSAKVLLRWA